jgi:PAS domain S-box-containing protein
MSAIDDTIRVLHVDDDPDLADLVATYLEREDDRLAVRTASSADEGLELMADTDVDCIVSDYDMPGRNGIEFLEAVREERPEVPFILYTGKGSEEVASGAISAGVTDYLQKTTGTEQYALLANRIGNAVAQSRARREVERTREYFGTILSGASDYVMIVGGDGRIDYVSPAVERVMGYTTDELEDGDPFETVHPEDRSVASETFSKLLEQPEEDHTVEFRGRHADGSWRWLEVRGRNLLDDPVIEGVLVNVRDVTGDHRRRERRERHRETILELATDRAVTTGDFETATRRITETAADVLEVSRVNVWLMEEKNGEATLTCVDHYDRTTGEHASGMQLATEEYPAYFEALDSHQAIDADDAREDPRTAELTEDYLDVHDVGALLDATLRSEGDTVGVVCHEHVGGRREWTDDEIDFASDVADVVHRALRNRERTEREEELERKTRAMDEAPVGITITDATPADNSVIYANSHFRELTGYSEEEILGRNCRFLQGEGTDPEPVAEMREAIDAEERVSVRLRNYRKDGTEFWNQVSVAPVRNDDGAVTNYVGFQQDVTDRRSHERVLREMYDVISDRHQSFDEQVRALLELGRAELDVRYGTLSEIRGDDYVFEVVAAADDSIQAGDVVPVSATNCEIAASNERTLVLGDVERDAPGETDRAGFTDWGISCYLGAPVFVDEAVYGTFCFYDTEPRPDQFSEWEVTLVDLMSGWVSYELQRRRATERLQTKNEQLEQFASIVSHDLRNPLNVARGRLELAREDCDTDHIDAVGRAHERMEALITDLLTLAREDENATDLSTVGLATLAENCWRTVETGDATLVATTDRRIRADESRLRQLFENLIRNAVEHGSTSNRTSSDDAVEHGGTHVTVMVGDLEDGFYVEDDGPGIRAEDRAEVFETGYSTSEGGTGFGLSIVEGIVEAHGWDVRVTDGPEGGARFEITGVEFTTE